MKAVQWHTKPNVIGPNESFHVGCDAQKDVTTVFQPLLCYTMLAYGK